MRHVLLVALVSTAAASPRGTAVAPPQADKTDFDRDLLVLAPNRQLEVRVLRVDDKKLVYLDGSREVTVDQGNVKSVERSLDLLPEFLTRCQAASGKDAKALIELAQWCEGHRLRKCAQIAWMEAALVDRQNDVANKALGNVKGPNGWLWPWKGARLSLEDLNRKRMEWGDAWQLASLHYDLRTDVALGRALSLLRDLEWYYVVFFRLYGKELALDDRPERLTVHCYRDRAKMPSLGTHVGAYFDSAQRILYTGFVGGDWKGFPYGLDHEATHQAFFHTFRFRATGGTVPAWLDEGFAEYMRIAITRTAPGQEPKVDTRHRDQGLFAAAAGGRQYEVERILTLESADFQASSGQAEKYARSYALVHFLSWGGEMKWRKRFFDFVRAAWDGKGQSSTFKRIFEPDLERLKKDFEAWVRG